jgi:hypothetical protein
LKSQDSSKMFLIFLIGVALAKSVALRPVFLRHALVLQWLRQFGGLQSEGGLD